MQSTQRQVRDAPVKDAFDDLPVDVQDLIFRQLSLVFKVHTMRRVSRRRQQVIDSLLAKPNSLFDIFRQLMHHTDAKKVMTFVYYFRDRIGFQELERIVRANQSEVLAKQIICYALTTRDIKHLDPDKLSNAISLLAQPRERVKADRATYDVLDSARITLDILRRGAIALHGIRTLIDITPVPSRPQRLQRNLFGVKPENPIHRASVKEASRSLLYINASGADFAGAELENIKLTAMNLANANFSGARLMNANFQDAFMSAANLSGADLTNAILNGADLRYASFANAVLIAREGTVVQDANLEAALFPGVNLKGFKFFDVETCTQEQMMRLERGIMHSGRRNELHSAWVENLIAAVEGRMAELKGCGQDPNPCLAKLDMAIAVCKDETVYPASSLPAPGKRSFFESNEVLPVNQLALLENAKKRLQTQYGLNATHKRARRNS